MRKTMNGGPGEKGGEEKVIQNVSNCSGGVTGVYYSIFFVFV